MSLETIYDEQRKRKAVSRWSKGLLANYNVKGLKTNKMHFAAPGLFGPPQADWLEVVVLKLNNHNHIIKNDAVWLQAN